MLGYFYTHIKISKQSTKSAAPSPGTPKTKPDSAESTDLKAKCDNDKDTVTDDATDTEDATTEDVSKVKEEFADRKWPIGMIIDFICHFQSEVSIYFTTLLLGRASEAGAPILDEEHHVRTRVSALTSARMSIIQ